MTPWQFTWAIAILCAALCIFAVAVALILERLQREVRAALAELQEVERNGPKIRVNQVGEMLNESKGRRSGP